MLKEHLQDPPKFPLLANVFGMLEGASEECRQDRALEGLSRRRGISRDVAGGFMSGSAV